MFKKTSLVSFVVFLLAALAPLANAQCFGGGELGRMMAGPCAERIFRQAYAPVDFALGQIGQYAGYGQSGRTANIAAGAVTGMAAGAGIGAATGHNTRSALIGAGVGAAVGGLATHFATRNRYQPTYTTTPDGRQVIFAQSKPQKPLDCRKINNKNRAVCEAAAQEMETAARQEAEQQALAASPWRLYNRSGFTVEVFDGERNLGLMRVNQSRRVLEPTSGYRATILAPDFSGNLSLYEARIRPADNFQGWVITSPKEDQP